MDAEGFPTFSHLLRGICDRGFEGYTTSREDLLNVITAYKEETHSHFLASSGIPFLRSDDSNDYKGGKHCIRWASFGESRKGPAVPFMGQPFMVLGNGTLDCHKGPDRNIKKRERLKAIKEKEKQEHNCRIKGRRERSSKKVDCPASIYVKKIVIFLNEDYTVARRSRGHMDYIAKKLRHSLRRGEEQKVEYRLYVKFPRPECHENHELEEGTSSLNGEMSFLHHEPRKVGKVLIDCDAGCDDELEEGTSSLNEEMSFLHHEPRKVGKLLIDCDAGCDDAAAIIMALSHEDAEVVGICTVNGNTDVDSCTRNVLHVLRLMNRLDVPVFRGCSVTLRGDAGVKKQTHGEDGLGDCLDHSLVDINMVSTESAADAIVRLANENPGEVTLVALGPLTNIAVALHLDRGLGTKLTGLYIMGGNAEGETSSLIADTNFLIDPEAAQMVLQCFKSPLTLVPFNLCRDNSISWETYREMITVPSQKMQFVKTIDQKRVESTSYERYPCFDQLTMAVALDEQLVLESKLVHCCVRTQDDDTRGVTEINGQPSHKRPANSQIVTQVDKTRFAKLLFISLT